MSFPSHFNTFSFNGLGNRRAMAGTYRGACWLVQQGIFSPNAWTNWKFFYKCYFWKGFGSLDYMQSARNLHRKNDPKTIQKWISIFVKKTIKIQAWRHQNRGLEGSGAGLETSWAILGHPGRFWKRLGPSWKRLGGLLGRFEPKKVSTTTPKWLPKRSPNL